MNNNSKESHSSEQVSNEDDYINRSFNEYKQEASILYENSDSTAKKRKK